jgi:hypothetical protein
MAIPGESPSGGREGALPRLTRFDVLREIGRGGAGIVYAATERESGRRVALKTLRAMDGELLLQLKSEFRALQDIDHPNLIHLEDLMREGDTWFFTMELVNGVSFATYVTTGAAETSSTDGSNRARGEGTGGAGVAPSTRKETRFDEPRLRDALAQLAGGLSALHAVGKVHRDVKPANVLVTMEGRVVIIDLGLVRETTSASEESVTGTVLYMAPEQVVGEAVDPACDVYAIGVILYLCLTGRHPFEGAVDEVLARKLDEDPPAPIAIAKGVPEDLSALCMELLQREPSRRPTAADVVARVRRATPSRPAERSPHLKGARPFVGRARQFQALGDAFADLRAGHPVTVVVEGESGVGKSALVRRFTRTLPSFYSDVLVLAGRCHEREDVPYKALDGVVDAISEHLTTLPDEEVSGLLPSGMSLLREVFPVLERATSGAYARSSMPPVDLAALGMQEGRVRLFASLRELFTRLAGERPLVVVIDDMQWADGDSLALLQSVLRPPGAPPLLLVTTARTVRGETTTFGLPGDVRSIVVDRLTPEEATELAAALLLANGADPIAAPSVAAEAGGHPLFLDELVRHAHLTGGHAPSKVTLDDVFATRVTNLEPGPRRLLEVLAVAGIALRQSTAMLASGTSVREYGAFARTLRAGHLARTATRGGEEVIETYHDRVREAVVAHLADSARRADHAAVARALEASADPDLDALATHWAAAGDTARGLVFLLKAAEKAYRSLAFDRAARLYERALAGLSPDAPERQAARVRLADCFASAGLGVEAARAFGEAADRAAEREALDLRRRQAEHLLNAGRFEEGEAVMDQVLAAVGLRIPKSSLEAIATFLASRARLWFRGLGAKERAEADIPRHALTRIDASAGVASLLGMFHAVRAVGLQTRALLFALDAGEPVRLSRALAVDAAFLSTAGQHAAPKWAPAMARASEIAARIGTPHAEGVIVGTEALIHHMIGDWVPGYPKALRAREMLGQHSMGGVWDVRAADMVLLWCLTWTGRLGELQRELARYLRSADARGDLYAATSMSAGPAGALVWLCRDDPDFARRTVREAAGRWTHTQYSNQQYWSFFAEAQADLYEGKGLAVWEGLCAHWPKMKRALVLEVQIIRQEALFFRARTALVTAAERPALESKMLRAAASDARAIRGDGAPYSAPLADLILASVAATKGQGPTAVALLRGAVAVFDARGMQLYREAARWRLGQQVGGDEGRALVVAAERWAEGEGVKNPARMLALMAPGFAASATARRRLPA